MENFWVLSEHPFVTWHADVTSILDEPETLVELTCEILNAGRESDLVAPVEVSDLGFTRRGAEDLTKLVRQRWKDDGVVELFKAMETARVEARLSWFDRDDRIVEASTADLATVLALAQPVPGAIPRSLMAPGYSPVAFSGWRLHYSDHRILVTTPIHRATFGCALHSDIWFPYVLGHAHPKGDLEHWFDNRQLAERHTPRLNAFVERCAALVEKAGARWYVEPSESDRTVAQFVHSRGIDMAPSVPVLMPAELIHADWTPTD